MSIAVELWFDDETEMYIKRIWRAFSSAGLPSPIRSPGIRPHMTLGICSSLEHGSFLPALAGFVRQLPALEVTFEQLGVFPTAEGVVFAAPVCSPVLLAAHQSFHQIFVAHAEKTWQYYMPGNWVPHCTLGYRLSPAQIGPALTLALGFEWPWTAAITQLALVEIGTPEPREIGRVALERPLARQLIEYVSQRM